MTNGGIILFNTVGAAIAGGIGAGVANSADSYPVLKGALITGAINGAVTALILATQKTGQFQSGVSGALSMHNPRFP